MLKSIMRTVATVVIILAGMATATGTSPATPPVASDRQNIEWREVVIQSGPSYRGCHKDGFTGQVRFWYLYDSNRRYVYYVGAIDYMIFKGTNDGGNKANVYWEDSPGAPFSTESGIQDNQWHRLGGDYYRAGYGQLVIRFIFDKSQASDPGCIDWWEM